MPDKNINSDSENPIENTPDNNPDQKENSEEKNENSGAEKHPEENFESETGQQKGDGSQLKEEKSSENTAQSQSPESTGNAGKQDELKEKSGIAQKSSEENPSVKKSDTKSPAQRISAAKNQEGNYQISLLNKNLLRVIVITRRGVKINSSVTEKKTSVVTQSNEIYLYPRIDYGLQEVEILIELDKGSSERTETEADEGSIFKFDTINENLLKVKLTTNEGVRTDSVVRDKKTSVQTQSNRIYLQPKSEGELQEIEITIAIDDEKKELREDFAGITEEGKIKLIPNPEVQDLIQSPDYSNLSGTDPYSIGDVQEEGGLKNPFDALRKLIRKNLTIGIIAAAALHIAAAGLAFYNISKKPKAPEAEEQSRLIVIQDLPDPKIKLENVEDPNKPKVEETPPVSEPDVREEPRREITPRKIVRPPELKRPQKEKEEDETKLDSSIEANLTRQLDSLRKLVDETNQLDTALTDSTKAEFEIPDSLKSSFSEKDVGLAMYFPKSWKLTDQREINKKETEFKGVVLTDTTAEQPGTMTMFIFLDSANKDYSAEDFKTEFEMNDSNLTGFSKEPKTLAGFTEYRFFIFNKLGTEKLSVRASVRKQFFDQYKNEIEAVVRSISIRKKEDL